MPTIFNVGNSYNIKNKNTQNKITLQKGEKISGKIIRKEDNSFIIKFKNGSEFKAEIEGDIKNLKEFQDFEVDSFDGEKVKLKVIYKSIENNNESNIEFPNLLLNDNLESDNTNLLKDMIKFNIPLTKENIKELSGLIKFLDKLNLDDSTLENFIYRFLSAKNIDENSLKGQNIKALLNNFFDSYKTLSKEDILLFYENNIEFNSENIESYKNIFSDENKFFGEINNLKDEIKSNLKISNNEISNKLESKEIIETNINKNYENDINNKVLNRKFASYAYQKLDLNNKINLLSLLKSMSENEDQNLFSSLKDIILNNKSEFSNLEFEKAFSIIKDSNINEFINDIKEEIKKLNTLDIQKNSNINKKDLEEVLSKRFEKAITLNDKEFEKLKDILNIDNKINITKENITNISEFNNDIESNDNSILKLNNIIENEDILDSLSKEIKEDINNIGKTKKNILKDIISLVNNLKEDKLPEKIASFLKSSINEIKLFNKLSLEYYYADVPININNSEYPCKIIIKDKRKDNKKIDSSNIKMIITIDTKSLGVIDGYIKVLGKNLSIDLKCEENYTKIIDENKNNLISKIEKIGFSVDIKVIKKEKEVSLSNCREFFNEDFSISLDKRV